MCKFIGNKEDLSMLLVSAVRYALGRMTYIVSWTCKVINDNIKNIDDKQLDVMITDIENCTNYGMNIDKIEWINLLRELKEEQARRK